jgi:plasmid stability protein
MVMAQVLVRNIEDEVVEELKAKAEREGISLEEQLRRILREAAQPTRGGLLKELARIRAMTPPTHVTPAEDLIREIRDE